MANPKKIFDEKNIHRLFVISLVLKGLFALFEIIGGILILFISPKFILDYIYMITQVKLIEDPNDVIANHLLHWAQQYSVRTQHFAFFYLFSHGAIKLWLIVGLLRKKVGYYPIAIFVFILFIIYQLYRFSFTHSIFLIFLTLVDLIVLVLTWHEYRSLKVKKKSGG